jgi:hypothetical protein
MVCNTFVQQTITDLDPEQILEVHPPAALASIFVDTTSQPMWHSGHLLGLPIAADTTVRFSKASVPPGPVKIT